MSGISGSGAGLEAAVAQAQVQTQVAFAVAGKQQQAFEQVGDAMVQLVQQAANVQKQIASGYLDVRV